MKKIVTLLLAAFLFTNIAFLAGKAGQKDSIEEKILTSRYSEEYLQLIKRMKHLLPGSPEAFRIAERIGKIKNRVMGKAKADQPDEFVRILNEMKIPYGQTEHSYPINYKIDELRKAAARRSLMKSSATPLPWIERGPGNVAGRARGLIIDPVDAAGNTWFVGSVGGGIWKTTDAGNNWLNLTPSIPNLAVSALAMSISNPDIIYAGTGESMFNVDVVNGDGILKSTDHGVTWNQLSSTKNNLSFNNIARIIVDPVNPNIVIAATTSGRYRLNFNNSSSILKSINGGETWKEVYSESEIGSQGRVKKILQLVETPGNFNILYAGVEQKGILKSTNAGESWFKSNNGIDDFTGRFELAVSSINPSKIYAAAVGDSGKTNLYLSTNAGVNWNETVPVGTSYNWLAAQGWYDNTIVVHPFNDNVVYVGGVELFKIEILDGNARRETPLETGPVHVDHHNLMIIPGEQNSFRILNANDGGIGVSNDGDVDWSKPTTGMNTSQFYGIDKMPGGSAYIGGMQDNGTWRSPENPGNLSPWFFQIGGDGYETSWHFDDPEKMIGGYQYNGLLRSTDGGNSFSEADSGLEDVGSGKAPFITKIAKTNMEPDLLFAVGSKGVWKSTNFGGSWKLSPITAKSWGGISTFHDVKISRANPNIVWAGSQMAGSVGIHVSKDKGENFTLVPHYNKTSMGGISGLATHPLEDSTAYVLFSFSRKPKILRTTNLGSSWEDISGFDNGEVSTNGFPDVAVYDLLVFPHQPNTIWAGTEIGLFESTDNGASWQMANNGLPNVCIWDMTNVEDEVVVGTHGRGVWSVKIPEMTNAGSYKPLVKKLYQTINGTLAMNFNLRSLYDSCVVKVNGNNFISISSNTSARDTLIHYPVTKNETIKVQITGYKNNKELASLEKTIAVVQFYEAALSYSTDFNSPNTDFVVTGFSIKQVNNFSNSALHSAHPYTGNQNLVATLVRPIIVSSSNAFLSFNEIVLVESNNPISVPAQIVFGW